MIAIKKYTDSVLRQFFSPGLYYKMGERVWGKNGKYRIQYIETSKIKRWSGRDRSTRHDPSTIGAVWDGNWDTEPPRFSGIIAQTNTQFQDSATIEDSIFFKSFVDRFVNNQHWKETGLIKMFEELIEEHGQLTWPSYGTPEKILEKCEMLDHMFHDFRNGRVESQRQRLISAGMSIPIWKAAMQEILLDRSRDGEYLLADGRHRIILAKIAGVKYIPAIIAVSHRMLIKQDEHIK